MTAFSTDPNFVAPGAIPWFLLQFVGAQDGPSGSHQLTATTFIQRINTRGGIAPSTGCAASRDVGKKALVPYTADYFFYTDSDRDRDEGREVSVAFFSPIPIFSNRESVGTER